MDNLIPHLDTLRRKGFRVTPQRQIILDRLCQLGGHATTTDVFQAAREQMPAINLATVYRTLDFFCRIDLVTKTEISGANVYEIAGETPHHHLVCRVCGYTEILSHEHFDALAAHLWQKHRFKAEMNHWAVSGLCAGCQANGDEP